MAVDRKAGLPLGVAAALGAGLALGVTGTVGQSALTSGDELRPLYATSSDVAEGKQLADISCSNCHGADGVSTTKGVPNLASQRPSYLYLKLKADQLGSGGDEPHSVKLMKFLSDDALANVAAYYATLDPAPPPDAPAPKYDDPVAAGKIAAEPCAKCHGENGVSHKAGVPSLIGLHPKYLVETMQGYKSGDRPIGPKNEDMKKALDALGDQDLQHIALYYRRMGEDIPLAG
jgi:cytochrome c553